jgi:ubiquinone/menaquinone biosynthesis C-methylase UbiE
VATSQDRHITANRRRYNRLAPVYDRLDRAFEPHYRPGRALIGAQASGLTLEIGTGTGKNFTFYGRRARVFASDLSLAMLRQARRRLSEPVRALLGAEAATLPFRSDVAETVVATFVCCVQENPAPSLAEMARVLKPGGRLLCLDYTVPRSRPVRILMRWLQPVLHLVYGIHWDHDIPRLLQGEGLRVCEVRPIWGPAVRYIMAEKPVHSVDPTVP